MDKSTKYWKIAKKNLLRKGNEISGTTIKGYDFNKGVNYNEIVKKFASTGFQASQFAKAIEITNEMIVKNAFIYL